MDLSLKAPADLSAINDKNPAEMRWWAKELKTNSAILFKAVALAGNNPDDVRAWLLEQQHLETLKKLRPIAARQSQVLVDPEVKPVAAKAATAAKDVAKNVAPAGAAKPKAASIVEAKPVVSAPAAKAPATGDQISWQSLTEDASQPAAVFALEPKNKSKINAKVEAELLWWVKHLQTDLVRLKEALVAIGENPPEVKTYLQKRAAWEAENGALKRFTPEQYQASGVRAVVAAPAGPSFFDRVKDSWRVFLDAVLGRAADPQAHPDEAVLINDPANMKHWAAALKTDIATLRGVILTVGPNITRIRMYLRLRQSYLATRLLPALDAPPRYFLPKPVREALLRFRRWRMRMYDKFLPYIPVHRIPLIRNKYALRFLSIVVMGLTFQYVTGREKVDKLFDAQTMMQQSGLAEEAKAVAAGENIADPNLSAFERAKLQAQAMNKSGFVTDTQLNAEGEEIVNQVRAQLAAAEAAQNRRLQLADDIAN